MNLYDLTVENMQGKEISLSEYKDKVVLIVNTASKCGFTPQFEMLQEMYLELKDQDFFILGFPCNQFFKQDPGSNKDILEFCQLNYGVSFPMFAKLNVKGKEQSELYKYLVENTPVNKGKKVKWNFEKFLVNKQGEIVNRYASNVKPEAFKDDIKELL
jgi:glutathione peroxidase